MNSIAHAQPRCNDRARRIASVKFMALPIGDDLALLMAANDAAVARAFQGPAGEVAHGPRSPGPGLSPILGFLFRVLRRPWAARS